jgi:hypothetical protein
LPVENEKKLMLKWAVCENNQYQENNAENAQQKRQMVDREDETGSSPIWRILRFVEWWGE